MNKICEYHLINCLLDFNPLAEELCTFIVYPLCTLENTQAPSDPVEDHVDRKSKWV